MIIPAILEQDFDAFNQKLEIVKSFRAKAAQVDFCDGSFVENITLSAGELGQLPKKISWEAHLMVEEPFDFEVYKDAGFTKIIIHYESYDSEQDMELALASINRLGLTPAIAINPDTAVSVLSYDIDTVSNFMILSVLPGKQAQSFIEASLKKIKELRELAPNAIIEVDGGINLSNVEKVVAAGADECAVGSGIFHSGDPKSNYQALVNKL